MARCANREVSDRRDGLWQRDARVGAGRFDQEVVASADGRFLFAVNQGSNSVAVFGIQANGVLRSVGTYDREGRSR